MKPRATIKTTPDDFVVDEIPAYAPSGEGPHLYVCFRKRGLNTLDAIRRIADALDVDGKQAGFAGMKDRHAVTTQWASFPFPDGRPLPAPSDIASDGIEVLEVNRHRNKLKTGHLRGNRFTVTLRDIDSAAVSDVAAALERAGRRGVPNAFGEQRFGREGDNAAQALAWLRGERRAPRGRRQKRLYVSALQSHMFNEVLKERGDGWDRVLVGDLAQKHDSGGVFLVDEEALTEAEARAGRGAISATGPMFGLKMRWPQGEPERIERAVLEREVGSLEVFRPVAKIARGTRRPLRLLVNELKVLEPVETGVLTASFALAKGGYATTVLAHVCDARTPAQPHAS
jgi:tRNA pseudouridine13 synthase